MTQSGIKISAVEKGVHLSGSILWFDAHKSGEISFMSSALNITESFSKNTQFIQTTGTAKILESMRKKTRSLICQFNRPFSIGSIKLELLPAGSMLGSSSLFIESNGERLLYAPCAQPSKHTITRKMQLKKTDVLLLDANLKNLKVSLPSRKREKERLLEKVTEFKLKTGVYPIVTASSVGVSQELTRLFTEHQIPVSTHSQISRINKVYNEFGIELGHFSTYSKRTPKDKLIILPFAYTFSRAGSFPAGREVFAVAHDQESDLLLEPFKGLIETFVFNTKADGSDLKEIISAVQPKKVLVTGNNVAGYVDEFRNLCKNISPVYKNNQPSLF
jgi:hypothetical protein